LDQPAVLRREVAVAFADGAPGTLDEGLAQDPVREAGAAAQALAGTLVVARAETRPGSRMAGGGKAAHVTAEFGDDRLGGAAGHPRDGVEARDRVGLGGGALAMRPSQVAMASSRNSMWRRSWASRKRCTRALCPFDAQGVARASLTGLERMRQSSAVFGHTA